MLEHIKELADHMYWADSIIWEEVMKLHEKENQKRIKELLYHIHSVQNAYLDIWLKKQFRYLKFSEFKTYNDLADWGFDFHKRFKIFLKDLSQNQLNDKIEIPWTKLLEKKLKQSFQPSDLSQQIFQVIMHSTYHRGQVNKLIRDADGEPPLTDYIYWLWIGKPAGKWIE